MVRPARRGRLLLADDRSNRQRKPIQPGYAQSTSFPKKTCASSFTAQTGTKSAWNLSAETGGNPHLTSFEGVIGNLERRYRETQSDYIRMRISEFMGIKQPTCHGKRLRKEALAVLVRGRQYHRCPAGRSTAPWPGWTDWLPRDAQLLPESHRRTHPARSARARLFGGCRPGLPDPRTQRQHSFRRRSATHPPGDPGRLQAHGRALRAG